MTEYNYFEVLKTGLTELIRPTGLAGLTVLTGTEMTEIRLLKEFQKSKISE